MNILFIHDKDKQRKQDTTTVVLQKLRAQHQLTEICAEESSLQERLAEHRGDCYDIILFWQTMPSFRAVAYNIKWEKGFIVLNTKAFHTAGDFYNEKWRDYADLTIITEDEEIHKKALKSGLSALLLTSPEEIEDALLTVPTFDIKKKERSAILYGWQNWPLEEQPWPDTAQLSPSVVKKPVSTTRKNHPDVTIVTVVFNAIENGRRDTFLQNMDSVQAQSGIEIEHLIIDGASKDGTQQLVEQYQNTHYPIRMLSMPDHGIYEAMNRGIALAEGDYILFLNSDDYFHNSDGLAASVAKLRETRCSFSFAPIQMLGDLGYVHPHTEPAKHVHNLLIEMSFSHQSLLVARQVMLQQHGFDLSYNSSADYDFIIRTILAGHKGCYSEKSFSTFRLGGVSSNMESQSQHEVALAFRRLYNKYLGTHLTEKQAFDFYTKRRLPKDCMNLSHRLHGIVMDSFVGLPPQEEYHYSREIRTVIKKFLELKFIFLWKYLRVLSDDRFDSRWYYREYGDITRTKVSAAEHYLKHGWREGRDPSMSFCTAFFLDEHPEALEKNRCPLLYKKESLLK